MLSTIRTFGLPMPRTTSRVSSSDWPTFTTTSSQTSSNERMLASSGKQSRTALRAMVNPEILTTRRPPGSGPRGMSPDPATARKQARQPAGAGSPAPGGTAGAPAGGRSASQSITPNRTSISHAKRL